MPPKRLQTDRGGEFFALSFHATLREYAIKFRPIPPRSPHLNGKVERSQQTDWVEFYATADLADPDLALRLEEWQFFYDWRRPHTSLNGLTPMERYCALSSQTPYTEEIHAQYALTPERYQEWNYYLDRQLRGLKRSL